MIITTVIVTLIFYVRNPTIIFRGLTYNLFSRAIPGKLLWSNLGNEITRFPLQRMLILRSWHSFSRCLGRVGRSDARCFGGVEAAKDQPARPYKQPRFTNEITAAGDNENTLYLSARPEIRFTRGIRDKLRRGRERGKWKILASSPAGVRGDRAKPVERVSFRKFDANEGNCVDAKPVFPLSLRPFETAIALSRSGSNEFLPVLCVYKPCLRAR